jgi:putative oxidoreductase
MIVVSMLVAYLTADFEAVSSIFSDPDKFVKADPFPFLFTAIIVFTFGPGKYSIDAVLNRGSTKRIQRRQPGTNSDRTPIATG